MLQQTASNDIVSVSNLSKSFGDVHAVKSVSFSVRQGEIFGILGPNGAGKSTTIKMMMGLLKPDTGSIQFLGLDPIEDSVRIKELVGYVAEEPLIYKSLTPKELFNFLASVRGLKGEKVSKRLQEYLDALEAVQYYEKVIETLSQGNRQKVQIIAALLHQPPLLIFDEPLAGLDARSAKVVKEILQIHTEHGGSVILSTHIMEIAEGMCDRIGILSKGKLIALGSMNDLRVQAKEEDSNLEKVFLRLTEEDEALEEDLGKLRKVMRD